MRSMLQKFRTIFLLVFFVAASLPLARAQPIDTTVTLSYYNQDASYLFFPLPGQYGVTSGQDTARTVIGYSERFSAPWPVTYIDSVWILMQIDKLQGSALIPIEVNKAIVSNGHFYVDTVSAPLDFDAILEEEVLTRKPYLYSGNFLTQPKVDSTFFITVSAIDLANTQATLGADSVTLPTLDETIDEDVDRARILLDKPYRGQQQLYMAGTQRQTVPGEYDYSNFVMIAHVSNFQGGTAEVYPAKVDPLRFYVEKNATGELSLHYTLRADGLTTITLYDARGVAVETVRSARETMGMHELPLHSLLPNGIYYAALSANGVREVRPVAIAR